MYIYIYVHTHTHVTIISYHIIFRPQLLGGVRPEMDMFISCVATAYCLLAYHVLAYYSL